MPPKKYLIISLIVIFTFAVLSYFFIPRQTEAPKIPIEQKKVNQITPNVITPRATTTKLVIYTDSGFNPTVTTLGPGDSINFSNQSAGALTITPLEGASVSGTLIEKGKEKLIPFPTPGEWGYSDGKEPIKLGVVVVE